MQLLIGGFALLVLGGFMLLMVVTTIGIVHDLVFRDDDWAQQQRETLQHTLGEPKDRP